MNINASDVFLEVIGQTARQQLMALPGVQAAEVLPYARLGDATLHLCLHPETTFETLYRSLEASGLRVLGMRRGVTH